MSQENEIWLQSHTRGNNEDDPFRQMFSPDEKRVFCWAKRGLTFKIFLDGRREMYEFVDFGKKLGIMATYVPGMYEGELFFIMTGVVIGETSSQLLTGKPLSGSDLKKLYPDGRRLGVGEVEQHLKTTDYRFEQPLELPDWESARLITKRSGNDYGYSGIVFKPKASSNKNSEARLVIVNWTDKNNTKVEVLEMTIPNSTSGENTNRFIKKQIYEHFRGPAEIQD